MFQIIDVDEYIKQNNLPLIRNYSIDKDVDDLINIPDGLFSKAIFGDKDDETYYTKAGYIALPTYMPKFPVFKIVRDLPIMKDFRNAYQNKKLDVNNLKLTTGQGLSFAKLLTKEGWITFIYRLTKETGKSYSELLNTYLLKYKPEDLLTNKVIVLPPGFRDYIVSSGMIVHSELTKVYSELMSAADQYNASDNESAIKLYRAYSRLLDKLINQFGSKTGMLREQLASKVTNTSARSVIVPNDNLGIDEIGVPFRALLAMYAAELTYFILTKYRQKWLDIISGAKVEKLTASVKDVQKIIRKLIKGYDLPDYVKDFFKEVLENDVLPNAVVVYKRDPAIHKSSWLAGRPKIAESEAIELNTAVCAPLGADFDGDSVFGNVNIKVIDKRNNQVHVFKNQPMEYLPMMIIPEPLEESDTNQ